MNRRLLICIALLVISFIPRSYGQKGKSEISIGFGYWSDYSVYNVASNRAAFSTSTGSWVVSYRYYVTRDLTLGMGVGYENITTWGSLVTFAPELTATYLDTRKTRVRVKLYGAVSAGIVLFGDNVIGPGEADETGVKPWGFQGTPFGIRIGRQFAGFLELGYGYKGIVHGGMALRFPRILHPVEHVVE